jgi:hypothetical protein
MYTYTISDSSQISVGSIGVMHAVSLNVNWPTENAESSTKSNGIGEIPV